MSWAASLLQSSSTTLTSRRRVVASCGVRSVLALASYAPTNALPAGKYVNSGQICISPDYVLCTREMQPKLIASFKAALADFNPPAPGTTTATPLVSNPGFAKIINPLHFGRVAKLIEGTKGKVVIGGTKSEKTGKIEVTVVSDVLADDVLMQGAFSRSPGEEWTLTTPAGEIFGPVLPIMVMETKEDIVNYINAHDNPLALYVFTQKTANRDYSASPPPPFLSSLISPRTVFSRTRSGTFVQNDVLVVRVALLTTHLPNPPCSNSRSPASLSAAQDPRATATTTARSAPPSPPALLPR